MVPQFNAAGLLPSGVHWADWDEIVAIDLEGLA